MIILSSAVGFLLGILATLTSARVSRRLRPMPTCTTCSTMTNWPVRGHDDRGAPTIGGTSTSHRPPATARNHIPSDGVRAHPTADERPPLAHASRGTGLVHPVPPIASWPRAASPPSHTSS